MPEAVQLNVGLWVRFNRYDVQDGIIRPAPGATLERYDPWSEVERSAAGARTPPYGALLGLMQSTRFEPVEGPGRLITLAPDSETRLTDWCAQHGLLGVLLHRAQTVTLAPRWRILEGTEDALIPAQQQLVRTNQGWMRTERQHSRPGEQFTDRVIGGLVAPRHQAPRHWPEPSALVQDLRMGAWTTEALSPTWARFFPHVPDEEREIYPYPLPGTDAFWEIYREPVLDFYAAATFLLGAIRTLAGLPSGAAVPSEQAPETQLAIDGLNRFLGPVGPAAVLGANRQLRQQWSTSSLLGAYAMMALMDTTEARRPRLCDNCGALFVSKAYQARYCSETCRHTFQKRRYRRRMKESATNE